MRILAILLALLSIPFYAVVAVAGLAALTFARQDCPLRDWVENSDF